MAQLQKGTTYLTGDQVTAANLNALVDSGLLIAGAITDQTAKTVPLAADTILLHSAADTALRKTTMTQLFATPQPLGATTPSSVAATTGTFSSTLGVTGVATLGNGAILGTPASGAVTNLTGTASININGTLGATTPSTISATTIVGSGSAIFGNTSTPSTSVGGTQINNPESVGPSIFSQATLTGQRWIDFMGSSTTVASLNNNSGVFSIAASASGAEINVSGTQRGLFSSTGLAVTGKLSLSQTGNSQTTDGYRFTRSGGAATASLFMGGDDNAYLYNTSAGGIKLFTGNTDNRGLTIDGSGNVTISGTLTTSSYHTLNSYLNLTFPGSTNAGIYVTDSTDTSGATFHIFRKANTGTIGSITRVTTTDAVTYNTTSDARLKANLRNFTDSGRLIDALKPRVFDWKDSDSNGKDVIGFVAQEEHAADPIFAHIGAVSVGDDDPTTITKQWQRSDSALIPILVAELQSLRKRLAALESK